MQYTVEEIKGMSDLEIEKATADLIGTKWHLSPSDERNETNVWIMPTEETDGPLPKYGSDWSVTGPLMVEYKLTLSPISPYLASHDPELWRVSTEESDHIESWNKNPLRAVLEVILMIGDKP